jgi:outer membrane protein assembly factor BamD (BamD/ComL family)
MQTRRCLDAPVIWLTVALALLMLAAMAGAQETYELGEAGLEKIDQPAPDTPAGQLQQIRRLIAADNGAQAQRLASRFIDEYPAHPLIAEAYLLRGDAKASRGHYYSALFDYEYLLRAYPQSEHFATALARELAIANTFGGGVYRRFLGMRIISAYGEAEELYIRIQERAPGSDLAERAGKQLGDFYFHRADMPLAAEAYDLFLENYPRSLWREHALQRQIEANLATFKGPRFDARGLYEAQDRIEQFKQTAPIAAEKAGADSMLVRIDESLAEKTLVTANWYQRRDQRVSAVFMYRRVIEQYPDSAAAVRAAKQLEAMGEPVPQRKPAAADDEQADGLADQPAGEPAVAPADQSSVPEEGAAP